MHYEETKQTHTLSGVLQKACLGSEPILASLFEEHAESTLLSPYFFSPFPIPFPAAAPDFQLVNFTVPSAEFKR
jgi:hypothetical protein